MKIRTKLPLSFALMACLVLFLTGGSFYVGLKTENASRVEHGFQSVYNNMLLMEGGLNAFKATHEPEDADNVRFTIRDLKEIINAKKTDEDFTEFSEVLPTIEDQLNVFQAQFITYEENTTLLEKLRLNNALIAINTEKTDAITEKLETVISKVENAQLKYYLEKKFEFLENANNQVKKAQSEITAIKETAPQDALKIIDASLAQVNKMQDVFSKVIQTQEDRERSFDQMLMSMYNINRAVDVSTRIATEKITHVTDMGHKILAINGIASLLIAIICALLNTRSIVKPIAQVITCMESLGQGMYDIEIKGLNRKDEIGSLLRQAEVFRANGLEMEKLRTQQIEAEKEAEQSRREAILETADRLESRIQTVVEKINNFAENVLSASEKLTANASQTGTEAEHVSTITDEASQNVELVSLTSIDLTSSIDKISKQVTHVSDTVRNAVDDVNEANSKVKGLAEAASSIGEVVSLIHNIAEQTNLLALNATIEAARAGEAGKGFAVVASEVKALANETAKATDEIEQQVLAIQGQTDYSVNAIQNVTNKIREIDEMAGGIAAAVEDQHIATGNISKNVELAANGTLDVRNRIEAVASAAQETNSLSNQLHETAISLNNESHALSKEIQKFLLELRT